MTAVCRNRLRTAAFYAPPESEKENADAVKPMKIKKAPLIRELTYNRFRINE